MDFERSAFKIEFSDEDDFYIITTNILDVHNDYIQLNLLLKGMGAILNDDWQINRYLSDAKKLYGDPYHKYDKIIAEIERHLFYHAMVFFCPVTPNDFAEKACKMAKLISRITHEVLEEKDWSLEFLSDINKTLKE